MAVTFRFDIPDFADMSDKIEGEAARFAGKTAMKYFHTHFLPLRFTGNVSGKLLFGKRTKEYDDR